MVVGQCTSSPWVNRIETHKLLSPPNITGDNSKSQYIKYARESCIIRHKDFIEIPNTSKFMDTNANLIMNQLRDESGEVYSLIQELDSDTIDID